MSDYYLADDLARKRERERERSKQSATPMQAQDVKVTLLGDFLIASSEPQGFDPYNSTQGKPSTDVWKAGRNRR